MRTLTVGVFYKNLKTKLKLRNLSKIEVSFEREITKTGINKAGLALAGYFKGFKWRYIQVFAKPETFYINKMAKEGQLENFEKMCEYDIPCFINLSHCKLAYEFVTICEKNKIPIFSSSVAFSFFNSFTTDYIEEWYAPTTQIHGTLVDVYGTGLLIMGRSGIGKSEIALDLIERGHRLVTDDVVTVVRRGTDVLIGESPENLNSFMEIRGIGIINIKEIFGTRAVRMQKRIEMIIHLEDWDKSKDYERVGMDSEYMKIHEVKVPIIRLPIYPGKNITVLAETIALNLHLSVYGYNAAKDMNNILIHKMSKRRKLRNYLNHDYE